MSLNQPLLLSSALVHQVLLSPTTYPYKQVNSAHLSMSALAIVHQSRIIPDEICVCED
jgi:hypothetical protein